MLAIAELSVNQSLDQRGTLCQASLLCSLAPSLSCKDVLKQFNASVDVSWCGSELACCVMEI